MQSPDWSRDTSREVLKREQDRLHEIARAIRKFAGTGEMSVNFNGTLGNMRGLLEER
jgi:hypothetical protein